MTTTSDGTRFSNSDLADIFDRISNLLEIKGEMVFKIRSYQRAAESLRALSEDINIVAAEGRLNDIPGVGKAIAEKIQELLSTGKLGFLERLETEVPPTLLQLLEVPDLGPRRVALFWKQLGITDLAGLEQNARAGKLRELPGMGEKSEVRIIAGIEALGRRTDRMTLGLAWEAASRWLDWLRVQPGVLRAETGGSLRRWRETIGDLDLVAAIEEGCPVMDSFIHHQEVAHILGQGDTKSSVELKGGIHIQLWVTSLARFGSMLVYATGSKAHNVRIRELALKKKLSLSDRGLQAEDGQLREYAEEAEVYAALGLPWIPPELREDRGEIEAALHGSLPRLVETSDIKAELHTHTTWSDGTASIMDMAQAAIARGYTTYAITDHDASLGITGGLDPQRVAKQRIEIQQVQAELGSTLRLLQGIEVDILSDGHLALPDDVLAGLDIVIASLHVNLRQPREAITERLLSAIRNPHVDVIAHPSGRLLPNREGADLNWDLILPAAKEAGVAMEINASPSRLDLNDVHARRAIELGIPLVINTDAHTPRDLAEMPFGISVARRAWASPEVVINTWNPEKIVGWLKKR